MTGADPSAKDLPPRAYERMAFLLRAGLVLSLVILVAGLIGYRIAHPDVDAAQAIGTNPILQYLTASGLVSGLAAGSPAAYLTLGLIVLVATPIVRVLSGFYYFERNGERPMAAITLTVMLLLLFGLLVLGPLVR